MRLLYVEDEIDILESTGRRLEKEGYSVDLCADGSEAISYIDMADYDVIILDVMLPGKSGIEILQYIRSKGLTTPVILLTARDTVEDRVLGLDAGSDDYLVKPFAFEELSARIRALLRRPADALTEQVLQLADLTLDPATHQVQRAGKDISLSQREYTLLHYMMRNIGIVLSRERIEEHIYNYDFAGGSNVVDVYIRFLRKKIDKDFEPKLIHTVRGVGYVLKEG